MITKIFFKKRFFIGLAVLLIAAALPLLVFAQSGSEITSDISDPIEVTPTNYDFGTVFPGELLTFNWEVKLNNTFLSQDKYKDVTYKTEDLGPTTSNYEDLRLATISTQKTASETDSTADTYNQSTLNKNNDVSDVWTKTFQVFAFENEASQAYLAQHGSFASKYSKDYEMNIAITPLVEATTTETKTTNPTTLASPQIKKSKIVKPLAKPSSKTTTSLSSTFPKTGLAATSMIMLLLALISLLFSRTLKEV